MIKERLSSITDMPDNLLSSLEARDVALWVRSLPKASIEQDKILAFLGLPWKLVISEISDSWLIHALDDPSKTPDYLAKKRGFVQIIDSDPSRIQFPQRCLPIYLLNGRQEAVASNDFENQLRRMTMLEAIRRSMVREILVISGDCDPVPPGINDLWSSGFRSYLTFASDYGHAKEFLDSWVRKSDWIVSLSSLSTAQFIENALTRYTASYPEDRLVIRVRDQKGSIHKVDITEVDDSERPILENHSLLLDRDLSPLQPEELSENDLIAFFQNPQSSWRPYAAGIPWIRDSVWTGRLDEVLKKLNTVGSDENTIAYISSEPGAGGTTVLRALAWRYARDGYPVLVADQVPFVPDSLAISNFLLRAHRKIQRENVYDTGTRSSAQTEDESSDLPARLYETPWILVYDRLHWDYRENELRRFCRELQKSGRPVVVLVVTDSVVERSISEDRTLFKHIGKLDHILDLDEARKLGRHLNKFLRIYGKERHEWQWEKFHNEHTIQLLEGFSSFWIALSFWIQGQYDMSESIQEWMYRSFKNNIQYHDLMEAILEIAAMSSERLPLPAGLLPKTEGELPLSHRLEECKSCIPSLGLVPIKEGGNNYWALVHDILGRFLINGLFYDYAPREALGFADAKDPEHLRFLILCQVSKNRELGEDAHRAIAENFATLVFKIDPDHGKASFALYWREVLHALDSMPQSLRHNNRVFLHHSAISRRRIAQLNEEFYNVKDEDRIALLERAVSDINYALNSIEYVPGSESNLNLYNSLARAYLDLANVESKRNATPARIAELSRQANDATRRAYQESPTNSYVVETYVKNLLVNARSTSDQAVENCIEALGILFSALESSETYRFSALGGLADQAMEILLTQTASEDLDSEPANAVDVLVKSWRALNKDVTYDPRITLSAIPEPNRLRALEILEHPKGRGNMQALRLSYLLTSATYPTDFKKQIEFLDQLENTAYRVSPQQKLEYAILLYQNNRAPEGSQVFKFLRRLWRESEHFVHVPTRLHWLWAEDGVTRKKVKGFLVSDYGFRATAKVQEFGGQSVYFRPEEFSIKKNTRPGENKITCYVSFGHNGPFLRPTTARSTAQ